MVLIALHVLILTMKKYTPHDKTYHSMVTKKHTIFVAVLAAVLALAISFGPTYAELPDEIKEKALEGKQIWERIEELQSKTNPTEAERLEITNLQANFESLVIELNPYGISTQEQWDADPDYWTSVNIPAIPNEDGQTEGSYTTASCNCPQRLWFISGYTYWLWGFWPSTVFGEWDALRNVGDYSTSTAIVDGNQDRIKPFTKFTLSRSGEARATLDMYGETENGDRFWDPADRNVRITSANPAYATVHYSVIRYVADGSDIVAYVTLNSIR